MSDILYIGLKITLTEIKLKIKNNTKSEKPPYLAAFRITKFDNHLQK